MAAINERRSEITTVPSGDVRLVKRLKAHGIGEKALETLYLYLGKGDRGAGILKFEKHIENPEKYKDRITIERVGFDKNGERKFYIMINKQKDKGGWNQFNIGISRKGSLRGILRPIPECQRTSPQTWQTLSRPA